MVFTSSVAAWLLLCAAGDATLNKSQRAVEKFFAANEQQLAYEYQSKVVQRKLNDDGSTKLNDTRHVRYIFIDGLRATIFLERNGKVATTEEIRQQEREARARLASTRRATDAEVARQKTEAAKKRSERLGFLREFPDAFDFKVSETKFVGGRSTSIVEFWPRPGFKPKSMRAKVFTKSKGKLWLDEEDLAVVRLEAEAFEDMSVGGFLANIGKGSRFVFTQQRVDKDVWLPESSFIKVVARILFKSVNSEDDEKHWDYRKPPQTLANARSPSGL